MKWYSRSDAVSFVKCQGRLYASKHRVVLTRHWSMERWGWVPCYAVVMK